MTTAARPHLVWTPPAGMAPKVVAEWRAFYRAALLKYGVTPQFYRDMYVAQHGVCYICRVAVGKNPDDPKARGGRRLGIDHNHVTGAVRGLLCSGSVSANTCNRLIGRYNLAQLRRAVEYLETEPAQTVASARLEMDRVGQDFPDADGFLTSVLGLK